MSHPVSRRLPRLAVCLLALAAATSVARAQTLEKVADFRNIIQNSVYQGGSSNPYDNAIQINNRLWFTTNKGGLNDAGTISYYDLGTKQITAFVSLDGVTGNTPQSSLSAVGNTLYFTTSAGGSGGTGTLASVDMTSSNPAVSVLYNLGQNGTASTPANYLNARNPGGGVTAIANANGSTDLYFTTTNGGSNATGGAAAGTISRYNTVTGYSVAYNFTSTPSTTSGRQPQEGFTNVGGKLYFTTLTGGANQPSSGSLGAGTLSVFDPATGSVSVVASLTAGNGQFGSHNVLQASNGLLYFTTVGSATQPGSLQSFNLATGVLSTVYALSPAVNSIFPEGRFAYGSLLEYNNYLYFATMQGGLYNRGTINAFDLNSGTLLKLADLDGGQAENRQYLGQGARGGFTLVNENGVNYLYLLTNGGGIYNASSSTSSGQGTILRLTPIVPEPGTVAMLMVAGAGGWLWRRRRGGLAAPVSEVTTKPVIPTADRRWAFTLIELLVVLGILSVFMGVAFPIYRGAIDKGQEANCVANLRQIGAGYLCYSNDHDGYFPNADAIGNSKYRRSDDALGLPILFGPYIGTENTEDKKVRGLAKVWLCPAGRPSLKTYGNNYAWTVSGDALTKPLRAIQSPSNTLLAYDNIKMTLPSTPNVPEGANGGPITASAQYQFNPHRNRSRYNFVYADGHAAINP